MTIPAVRWTLLVAGVFVLVAGVQTFVLSERTDDWFAWTIQPPLTAAFLGAGYWAAAIVELGSARRAEWPRARVAMPAVLIFTTVTLLVTLIHLDRFDLDTLPGIAWLAVYAAFPPLMAASLALQLRRAGPDPPRGARLPRWIRAALIAQAAVMLALGLALLVSPADAAGLWPWTLTPLTGRAVGAWLVGVGVIAAHMALEDDNRRTDLGMLAYAAYAGLVLIALARYPDVVEWTPAGAVAYLGFLAVMLVTGVAGLLAARRGREGP